MPLLYGCFKTLDITQLSQDQCCSRVRNAIDVGQQITLAAKIVVVVKVLLDRFECFIDSFFQMLKH
uniref:hypothetical protein n=1 Tax=Pseudomonas sp. TTU2014-080ASC TaxID=1729724 RepID=UPI000A568126|nr:hypothetical protein [Pseudomonas sp. TTU2014-080ASC]